MPEEMPKTSDRKSIDELADYYDRTDATTIDEGPVDWEPVPPKRTYSLRLDERTGERLRRLAERRGIRPTVLMREWIEQRLSAETSESVDEVTIRVHHDETGWTVRKVS